MRGSLLGGMAAAFVLVGASQAFAQVFEVIHPDVEQGGFELESLNGVTLGNVEAGEERSAHELAFGYAPFSFWKTTVAVEFANPEGEGAKYEGFEWENVLLAPLGGHGSGHDHDHDHGDGGFFSLGALGLFVALEVPNGDGINDAAIEVGPIAEFSFGPVETVANFLFEIPFQEDEDPGISYALQVSVPVAEFDPVELAAGFEAHGGAEGLLGDAAPLDENSHVIGPALYGEIDLGGGVVLEPRIATLFGLTEGSPDAVLSFNVELKF